MPLKTLNEWILTRVVEPGAVAHKFNKRRINKCVWLNGTDNRSNTASGCDFSARSRIHSHISASSIPNMCRCCARFLRKKSFSRLQQMSFVEKKHHGKKSRVGTLEYFRHKSTYKRIFHKVPDAYLHRAFGKQLVY